MAKVDLYSALEEDLKVKEAKETDASYIESFLSNDSDSEESSEEYVEWLNKINNSSEEEKKQIILEKIKEQISEEDGKCIDRIIELLDNGTDADIVTLDKKLKAEFPNINPFAIFQMVMLLMGAGVIQLNNE